MEIENEFASFWIEREILFFLYKEFVNLTLSSARQIVADRLAFQQEKAYPVLCNIRGVQSINIEARRYLATEGTVSLKAIALVSDTPLACVFSEIYIKGNTPPIPTQICCNNAEALSFLSMYKV